METEHESEHKWWHAPWEFLVHVIVGILIFVVIAAPAVGLDFLIGWLENKSVGKLIIYGLKFAEYTLFFVDLALFAWFVVRTAWRSAKKM
ncbi:MAG: hypothetical protein IH820_00765 [Bacteroidetes bacterium]|nr:hypothetical protein [Bacteroidota bacterium]